MLHRTVPSWGSLKKTTAGVSPSRWPLTLFNTVHDDRTFKVIVPVLLLEVRTGWTWTKTRDDNQWMKKLWCFVVAFITAVFGRPDRKVIDLKMIELISEARRQNIVDALCVSVLKLFYWLNIDFTVHKKEQQSVKQSWPHPQFERWSTSRFYNLSVFNSRLQISKMFEELTYERWSVYKITKVLLTPD